MELKVTTRSVSDAVLDKPDLLAREKAILSDIQKRVDFIPEKRLGDSRYWTRDYAGAVFYRGKYKGRREVLKIQGTKPPISEIDQISEFEKQNQSQIIRPPKLNWFLRWDENKRYEALFLEDIDGELIIHNPTNRQELKDFFDLYREYRNKCRTNPWLMSPQLTLPQLIQTDFGNWKKIAFELYPKHPDRKDEDAELVDQAVAVLIKNYSGIEPEFLHGHFSYNDLVRAKAGDVILFSNLFWKYKAPFYDAVFAYHWAIYHLAKVKEIGEKMIEAQRRLWLEEIYGLAKTEAETKLINLALLERAAAGLNLDALSIDPKLPMAKYLVEATRAEVQRLLAKITRNMIQQVDALG